MYDSENIKNMTFEEKLEYSKVCIEFINNFTRYANDALESGNKDLAIEYLKLKGDKAMELANIYSLLLEQKQEEDLKSVLAILPIENDTMN